MARMVPSILPDETESQAEKDLFPILQTGLDGRFTVFHSFNLLSRNLKDYLVEGEIDFLVASQETGLLVIEVKTGKLVYSGEEGCWYQNDRPIKDPFKQASASMHQLESILRKRMHHRGEIPIGYAVAFPDVAGDMVSLPANADPAICVTGKNLANIQTTLVGIARLFQKPGAQPIAPGEWDRLHRVITPYCEYGCSLADAISLTNRVIFRLTEEQCLALDFIKSRQQALIKGCTGSGKTVLVVKLAREFAAEGKTVLLLAFNKLITQQLAAQVADLGSRVQASTYHDYCSAYLEAHGSLPARRESDPSYWNDDVPEAFESAIRACPTTYDVIIVDEGQDFRTAFWAGVISLVKPDGRFYVFYDPYQNLFQTEMDLPIADEPFPLRCNCRNAKHVFEAARLYGGPDMKLRSGMPDGEPVKEFVSPYPEERLHELRSILHHLLEEQGLKPWQVVILGGHALEHTCVGKNPKAGKYTVVQDPGDLPNTIAYHTYMKFKGCEADAVILLDVDPDDARWKKPAALYTAMSRSRNLLYVIRAK